MQLGRKTLKSSKARTKKIDATFERAAYAMLVCYALFTCVVFISRNDAIRVDNIRAVGMNAASKEDILKLAADGLNTKILYWLRRDNALLYPKETLHTKILALDSHIESVDIAIEKKQLAISVHEYTPKYLWCRNSLTSTSTSDCYFANERGYIYASAPQYTGNAFITYKTLIDGVDEKTSPIKSEMLSSDTRERVEAFIDALKKTNITPMLIEQTGKNDFTFKVNRPWAISWSTTQAPDRAIENLRLLLASTGDINASTTLSSIDLRFDGKIFYK